MTEAKHTPGPWQVGSSTGHNACRVYDSKDESVCTVYGIFVHQSVEQVKDDSRCAEGMANARLIAAAPDMLELLKQVATAIASLPEEAFGYAEGAHSCWPIRDELGSNIDAVIAKATGAA